MKTDKAAIAAKLDRIRLAARACERAINLRDDIGKAEWELQQIERAIAQIRKIIGDET